MIKLDIKTLKLMLKRGVNNVLQEKDHINTLNVFPVPDGDTGTNLSITLANAYESIEQKEYASIDVFGQEFARALLMNARGNSGVILSQIIKGFVSTFKPNETEISINDFVDAFDEAQKKAYKIVAKPIEGTMLTVIRLTAYSLQEKKGSFQSIEDVMKTANIAATDALKKTPDMLQELKEAGVVDSGGYGLCCLFNGMLTALHDTKQHISETLNINKLMTKPKSFVSPSFNDNNNDFGYCCEYILLLGARVHADQPTKEKFDLKHFENELSKNGTSLVVVEEDKIVKVHVHTFSPHLILFPAKKYGEFDKVKIENMTQQFLENNPGSSLDTHPARNVKKVANVKIIATVASQEIANIYEKEFAIKSTINVESIGAPSIQHFYNLINESSSTSVILVIDDSNLMMAATEACKLVSKDIKTYIINVHNAINSYLICERFDPLASAKENLKTMYKTLKSICSGSLSISVKSIKYSHISVSKGQYIGICDKKIVSANNNQSTALKTLVDYLFKNMKKAKHATILVGKNSLESTLRSIKKYLTERHNVKINTIYTQQEIFSYHIALTQ